MTKKYEAINTITLSANNHVSHLLKPEVVYLEDPATTVFNDFQYQKAQSVAPNDSLSVAVDLMHSQGNPFLLVCDDNDRVVGAISSLKVLGEKPYKTMRDNKVTFDEIKVKQMMVAKEDLLCIPFESITTMRVGHVISTFNGSKRHYALVIEEKEGEQWIRGYVSAMQISKQLGSDIREGYTPETLSEMKKILDSTV